MTTGNRAKGRNTHVSETWPNQNGVRMTGVMHVRPVQTRRKLGKVLKSRYFWIFPLDLLCLVMNIDKLWLSFFRYSTHGLLVGLIFLVDCPTEEVGLRLHHLTTKKRQVLTCVTVANVSALHDLRSSRQMSNFSILSLPSTHTSKIGISIPTGGSLPIGILAWKT